MSSTYCDINASFHCTLPLYTSSTLHLSIPCITLCQLLSQTLERKKQASGCTLMADIFTFLGKLTFLQIEQVIFQNQRKRSSIVVSALAFIARGHWFDHSSS